MVNPVIYKLSCIKNLHFFQALNDAFEVQFPGLNVYTISQKLIACEAKQLIFFKEIKVETLLINAMQYCILFLICLMNIIIL